MTENNRSTTLTDPTTVEYYKNSFDNVDFAKTIVTGKRFDGCTFKKCILNEIEFNKCEFVECEFVNCNLSMAKFTNTKFNDVVFENCKLIGIDWTKLTWPQIKLSCPMKFYQSDLSFSNFFEINLIDTVFEHCKAHEVDFRGADLRSASVCYTDFYKSIFQHCNLTKADFTGATNYLINITENKISKAKFSFPEVIGLLTSLDITITGLD